MRLLVLIRLTNAFYNVILKQLKSNKRYDMVFKRINFLYKPIWIIATLFMATSSALTQKTAYVAADPLLDLALEQLMNIEVTLMIKTATPTLTPPYSVLLRPTQTYKGYHLEGRWDLSLTGHHLLDASHVEFATGLLSTPTEMPRELYVSAR